MVGNLMALNDERNLRIPNFIKKLLKPISELLLHPRIGEPPPERFFDSVGIAPYKYDCDGALCISADFELAWVWMYDKPELINKGKKGRLYFKNILKELDWYKIPITWVVVGHLFLKSCKRDRKTNLAHSNMPRPKKYYENPHWAWKSGDWYQYDPCSNYKKANDWYAPDLINQIIKSEINHEIGTHTFSHVDFSDENCDKKLARAEIIRCKELMEQFGIKPKSMVFPGGFEGNFDILNELGITSYRGSDRIDISFPLKNKKGLWNIRESIFLFAHNNVDYLNRSIKYINKSIKYKMICHLSFHPTDLDNNNLKVTFIPILEFINQKRKNRRLWIATMNDISSYCEARDKIMIKSKRNDNKMVIMINHNVDIEKYGNPDITLKIIIPYQKKLKSVFVDNNKFEIDTNDCYIKKERKSILILTVPINSEEVLIEFD